MINGDVDRRRAEEDKKRRAEERQCAILSSLVLRVALPPRACSSPRVGAPPSVASLSKDILAVERSIENMLRPTHFGEVGTSFGRSLVGSLPACVRRMKAEVECLKSGSNKTASALQSWKIGAY